jgi:hypothetical protein
MRLKPVRSILKVLTYFDLFNYPVSAEEIEFFLDHPVSKEELLNILDQLVNNKFIFRLEEFYSLQDNPALRERRKKGNLRARSMLTRANRIARFLYRFPYVRGVGISGSLSKNFADEKADMDFFIITSRNRLWIARTIMHLFKKFTFLFGRQHWYCMNYYIDEEALRIEEQNIFTATELITLMPVCGNGTMDKFFRTNDWAINYFPNYISRKSDKQHAGKGWLKITIERIFNNRLGDGIDNYLMGLTAKRWKQKETEHRVNMRGVRMGLRTGKHFSKPNPAHFQKQVLDRYETKLAEIMHVVLEHQVRVTTPASASSAAVTFPPAQWQSAI